MRKNLKILFFVFIIITVFGSFFVNSVFADSVNITQINFTSSPQTIDENVNSAVLVTQTQNIENSSESVSETTTLSYVSTSNTGQFSNANISEETCNESTWSENLTLTLTSTRANKRFCYKDSTPGTYTLTISAQGQSWTPATQDITVVGTPVTTAGLTIRSGNTIILGTATTPFQVPLQPAGTISLNDSSGNPHSIDAKSVLSVLNDADLSDPSWNISDLQYFDSFSSFLLNCITSLAGNNCNNWQYTVNNLYPSVGMDKTILSGEENVYVYFGSQNRVVLNPENINTNDTLTVIAQKYDYQNDTWITRTGVTIGLTQPDPNNPFSPIEVKTGTVDTDGQVVFSAILAGSYNVGIKEDFYFPTEVLTVVNPPLVQTGGGGYTPPTFNVTNALAYLKSVQNIDGSFGGSDLYTDWVAIAYGAGDVLGNSLDTLLSYFNSHTILSSLLTDNERRAMALLALGQNPYSFNGVNYIETITKNFDGIQFGDASLVNDDIFALIPLISAGYTISNEIITKDIDFIILKQKPDGSWEESIDLTAVAIQALKSFESITGISDALLKASNYLSNGQNGDGGWNSVYSTSWAMQAMSALGASWTKGIDTPNNYLGKQQAGDGAALPPSETLQNRIWATSYAIPAALGKPWNKILKTVEKPAPIIIKEEAVDNEEEVKTINTEEKEKVIIKNNPSDRVKIKTSKIVENTPVQNILTANVLESTNQIPKAFSRILPLIGFLFLGFLLW